MLQKSALFQWTVLILFLKKGESCDGEGWLSNDGNCYKIFTESANKSVAELTCLELRSGLASISNEAELTFLTTKITSEGNATEANYWVGLHNIRNVLQWNNRASARSYEWVNVSTSTEESTDCFVFNGSKVSPYECSQEANFICEQWKDSGTRPRVCPPDTHKDLISDKCFWYTHMPLTKAGADVVCSLKYGRLLSMNGMFFPINVAMIITLTPPPPPIILWTSLMFKNGSFRYEDGSVFDHSDFTYRRGDGDCATLAVDPYSPYEVRQTPCFDEVRGFCESNVEILTSGTWTDIFTKPDTEISTTKLSCPHGSNWQEHSETGLCYWETSYETPRLSFEDAQKYCQSYGGNLASFHSIAEEKIGLGFLAGTVEHNYWIGLYYDTDKDSYAWLDGTPMEYTNWDDGQPSHLDRRMRCGYMSSIRKKWSLSYCGALSWFICKAEKQINPKKPVAPTPEPLMNCAGDSSEYFFNDYCYKKVSLLYGWHRAKQYCGDQNSNLASLHDENEVDFMIRLLSRRDPSQGNRVWIGLNSLGLNSGFKWTDGSPVDFTNWDANEPNNFQNQEKCTSMYSGSGMWNDENCNAVMNFICKRRNGTIPDTTTTTTVAPELGYCPDNFYMFDDRCFQVFGAIKTERKNWTEAGLHCFRMGGYLPSIRNSNDQAFMYYLMQNLKTDIWIGLHDSIHSGVFYWTDNYPLFYTNWAGGEPSSFGFQEDCVVVHYGETQGGLWKDTQCGRTLPYICQTNRDPKLTKPGDVRRIRCPYNAEYVKQGLSCYKAFTNLSSWEEAEATCAKDHGHLVSVYNRETEAVANYLAVASSFNGNGTFWIGLRYAGTYPLQWANGWPMALSQWGRDEPKLKSGQNTCFFSTPRGFWKGALCSEKKPFICQINADKPPVPITPVKGNCPARSSTDQWTELGKTSCALFDIRSSLEWYSANFVCSSKGASFASFHSMDVLEELQLYVRGYASSRSVYIGMSRNSEGGFEWSDGSPVDFVNWDQDEPRSTGDRCVQMRMDTMKWGVVACNTRKYYICQKQKDNMAFPTSSSFNSSKDAVTQGKSESSSGLRPGEIVAVVVCIIILVVLAVVVVLRMRRWKDDWNRYRVHRPEHIATSFENDTYGDELNNIDINDRNVLFAKH